MPFWWQIHALFNHFLLRKALLLWWQTHALFNHSLVGRALPLWWWWECTVMPRTVFRKPPLEHATWHRLLGLSWAAVWGAVCFRSPWERAVTDVRPRPAPTARSDGLLKQSAWGIRAVCFKSPSQRPFTDVRPRPALTDFWNNRREESVPVV